MKFFASLLAIGIVTLVSNQAWSQQEDEALLKEAAGLSAAVATILDSPRETPADQLSAIFTLINLDQAHVAAVVWKSLAEAELEDEAAANLAAKFGTARLLMLAGLEKPAGEETPAVFAGAKAFATRCIEAASKRARDPQRLAKLIAEVNNPAAEVRNAARVDLAATGIEGAQACLEALAQAEDESVRANLMLAITGLYPAVEPLLIPALVDSRGHFRRDVAELCGYLQINRAVPFLGAIVAGAETDPVVIAAAIAALTKLGHTAPNDAEARALLVREVKRIEAGIFDRPAGESAEIIWWSWYDNPEFRGPKSGFISIKISSKMARLLATERLSKFLFRCGEPTQQQQLLAIIYHLETWEFLSEGRSVASNILGSKSAADFSEPLAAALKHNLLQAALTCITRLGEIGDSTVLISGTGRPSPLAAALKHGNRSLRFAALEAIMKLNPQSSFAGASQVPKALWEFAAGAGPAQAVAASSVTLRADDWAAHLRGLGYAAVPATSGRSALREAFSSPRIELLLVDSDIGKPRLREIVYQLRSHKLTARAPVAVLCSLINLEYAKRIADTDDKLFAIARPQNDLAMQEIVTRLQQLSDEPTTEPQRAARAVQAIQWIGKLLAQGHPYDELLRGANVLSQTVNVPGLVEPSLHTLAVIGTAGSQQTLVNFASQPVHPIEARLLATKSFAVSVEQFGKLLSLKEIRRQYERYNTSESAEADTQQVLGQILDVLENRDPQATNSEAAVPGLNP